MHNFDAFQKFADALSERFSELSSEYKDLFCADVDPDLLWDAYLEAFPEGSNPIFRERTEHDGVYDRQVLKRIGNVVALHDDLGFATIWEHTGLPYPYQDVADFMHAYLLEAKVGQLFCLHESEKVLGHTETKELLEDGSFLTWNHFYATVPADHRDKYPARKQGNYKSRVDVFRRGLETITHSSLSLVLELIDENKIYRGREFRDQVEGFKKSLEAYSELDSLSADAFVWHHVYSRGALIRNSVIGTLLVDLSEGVEIDKAVASFESKVAPTNYKRPTALITQRMIDDAMGTIREEGLEPALERRHARLSDVSVSDIVWVNNDAQKQMKGGVEGLLQEEVKQKAPASNKAKKISIQDFVEGVLPKTTELEAYVANQQKSNLVSITAPVDEDVQPLFKWDNNFAWSYNGEVTDAIKERVKAAGGNVDADLRVSLSWFNTDDLDIHCYSPYGHISYLDKMGILDVDANVSHSHLTTTPVENLAFKNPVDGLYRVTINQYQQRNSADVGFELQVAYDGVSETYYYDKMVKNHVGAICITVKNRKVVTVKVENRDLKSSSAPEDIWGIQTETFVPVNLAMLSPNHWGDNEQGNKHWFFILEGCRNDLPVRGIYNEFLRPGLEKHRKVFEILGSKTRAEPVEEQLSGLGFSSTKPGTLTVRAKGPKANELYEINFG